jgi:hypothetical protein
VTKATDEAHAVELAGLLLEAPDQKHTAIGFEFLLFGEFCRAWCNRNASGFGVSPPG